MAAASGVFRDEEEPLYHTAEELWEGLKHGDEGARLLFVFFLRLRKNEPTGCSVEKAIAAVGKRWVAVLIEEAWRLYLLMRHHATPYQGKPKSVIAIEGSRAQHRILARSALARHSAPSVKERAAVRLQTTWNKIHQQWVVLWMDNWYNEKFTPNPDKNDKSLNATALAVWLLRDAPRYWHCHRETKARGNRGQSSIQAASLSVPSEEKVISLFVLIYYARGLALCIPLRRPFCQYLVWHIFPCDAFYCGVVSMFARGLAQRRVQKSASCGAACNMAFKKWFWKGLQAHGYFHM